MTSSTIHFGAHGGTPAALRVAERLRARTASAASQGPGREQRETLRRLAPLLTGARVPMTVFDPAKLNLARIAFEGIDKTISKLIPRLHGFGTLLRKVLSDAAKLGARSLVGNLFGGSNGGGSRSGWPGTGGGSATGLGALLTSPLGAVIGGGIAAGLLIWNHFRNGTEKKLRAAIQSNYGVAMRDMSVLKQIKSIGEQAFGRGQVSRHLLETIQLDPVKEIIQSYADSTGQQANGLNAAAQLSDPGWAGNRFIRPADGAGGASGAVSGSSGSGAANTPPVLLAAVMGAVERLSAQVEKFRAIPAGHVLALGAAENPGAVGVAVLTVANDDYGFTDRLLTKTGQR